MKNFRIALTAFMITLPYSIMGMKLQQDKPASQFTMLKHCAAAIPGGIKQALRPAQLKRFVTTLTDKKAWLNWFDETKDVLPSLLKHTDEVAEVTASSPFLIQEITRCVNENRTQNPEKDLDVLEIGFGAGSLTFPLLAMIGNHGSFDGFECDAPMFEQTMKKIEANHAFKEKKDAGKFRFHQGFFPMTTATNPIEGKKYDHIVCTIPFTMIASETTRDILTAAKEHLKEGGTFTFVSLIGARARCLMRGYRNLVIEKAKQLLEIPLSFAFHQDLDEALSRRITPSKEFFARLAELDSNANTFVSKDFAENYGYRDSLSLVVLNIIPCWVHHLKPCETKKTK